MAPRLSRRCNASPDVATRIANIGFDVVTGGPDAVNEFLRADSKKHGDIIRQLKIKID